MPAHKRAVSVLGLAMMGSALAAAFLGAGHHVSVAAPPRTTAEGAGRRGRAPRVRFWWD